MSSEKPASKNASGNATAVEDHKLDPSTDTTVSTTTLTETEKPTPADLEKVIPMPAVRYAPEVISEQNAFLVREMLKSNIWGEPGHPYGTGFRARVLKRHDIGGKTGTSNQAKDAWYTGFGPNIVATTWVGFDNFRRDLGRHEFGGTAAQPAWINFMRQALKNTPEQEKQIPSDIVKVRIDRATGQLSNRNDASSMYEYFIKGTEPTRSVQQAVSEQKFDTETAEELF
ncbi:hypothetical protein UB39_04465 [Photobacterium angustum]|nr:hypothetical protein UB39_04465 [Photobacterium angustum]